MIAVFGEIRAWVYAPTIAFRQGLLVTATVEDGAALAKQIERRTGGVKAVRDGRELRIVEASWTSVLNAADSFDGGPR